MSNISTLKKVKLALRITTDAFDSELNDLIDAAIGDLMIAGVDGVNANLSDKLTLRAVTTYCKIHFGEPDEYDRLKASYDEQKAQLSMSKNWTTFPEA
jgi:hypothetical protein